MTHLSGAASVDGKLDDSETGKTIDDALQLFAKTNFSLKYLDVLSKGTREKRWLSIERKGDMEYLSYRWLQESELNNAGVDANNWGGFYYGSKSFSKSLGPYYENPSYSFD